jgi:hypothetical protein
MDEKVNGGDNSTNSKDTNLAIRAIHVHGGWNTTWPGMSNIILVEYKIFRR